MGNRKLLSLSIIPFILDLICLAAGLVFTVSKIPQIVAHLVKTPEIWYQYLLYYALVTVTAISLFFAVIFIAFIIANLLTFPFNDLIAERTLIMAMALPERPKGLKSWFKKASGNYSAMFKKTLIFLIVGGFIILMTLVPGLGIAGACLSVFLMAWDRIDYSFDHYRWSFKQRVSFVKKHIPEIIGFSGALGLTTVIPVINILVMPGSVVAGATLVSDILKKESSP